MSTFARMNVSATVDLASLTFEQAKELFAKDLKKPAYGHRDPALRKESGLGHITGPIAIPSTQQVLQAIEFRNTKTGEVMPLQLIDGYSRMQQWIITDEFPFDKIIVLIYKADMTSQEDMEDKTDALASTIDSRHAVKTKAERWITAARHAGLFAKSTAYRTGKDMQAYLNETMGNHNRPMRDLVEAVKEHMEIHRAMDELLAFADEHIPAPSRRAMLHPGVALALHDVAKSHGVDYLKTIRSALMYSCGYTWDAPDAVRKMANVLDWVSSAQTRAKYQAVSETRKDFYIVICAAVKTRILANLK